MQGTLSLYKNDTLLDSRTYNTSKKRKALFTRFAAKYNLEHDQWLNNYHFLDRPLLTGFKGKLPALMKSDIAEIQFRWRTGCLLYGTTALSSRYKVSENTILRALKIKINDTQESSAQC